MRKKIHLETFRLGDRELSLHRVPSWLWGNMIVLSEGKKVHARWGYSVHESNGVFTPVFPDYKLKLPRELRGKKLSSKIVDYALQDMKEQGATRISIDLLPDSDSAEKILAVFKNRGFKPLDSKKPVFSFIPVKKLWVWEKK